MNKPPESSHRLLFQTTALLFLLGPMDPVPLRSQLIDPPLDAFPVFELGPEPVAVIGKDAVDDRYLIGRIGWTTFLADGRIVMVDQSDQTIRLFNSEGEFLVRVGGNGDGPGEFRDMGGLGRTPDGGFWVWDQQHQRVSYFGPGGELTNDRTVDLRSFYNFERGGFPEILGTDKNGGLFLSVELADVDRNQVRGETAYGDSLFFYHLPMDQTSAVQVGAFDGGEWYKMPSRCGRGSSGIPNAPEAFGVVHEGFLLAGNNRSLELKPSEPDPAAPTGFSVTARPLLASEERLENLRQRRTGRIGPDPKPCSYTIPVVETVPLFWGPNSGSDGSIWVTVPHGPGGIDRSYLGFSIDGEPKARIPINPEGPRINPMGFGDERVLTFERNDFDEVWVEVWPLVRREN